MAWAPAGSCTNPDTCSMTSRLPAGTVNSVTSAKAVALHGWGQVLWDWIGAAAAGSPTSATVGVPAIVTAGESDGREVPDRHRVPARSNAHGGRALHGDRNGVMGVVRDEDVVDVRGH